ncbi:MAG: NADH-quinone oxidoreductase subunit H [Candidatus Omnitrophica bacterium]|nr:NADH-quinone oxidoreductase subunit H [Candidatus Omnitrophota bacterium]
MALSPFFFGVTARVKAVFAGRVGPPLVQPYFDIVKLFRKKCVYSRTTTWVFRASPVVVLAAVMAFSLTVPFGEIRAPLGFPGDILLAAYLLALARFFMIAAAMDTGSSMEGLGASREAFFSCFSELALFMNFIALASCSGNISLSRMIGEEMPLSGGTLTPALILVVSSFFILLLAENCRIPVDDPDTHLELTMIHEVMVLDHSGIDLAYLLVAQTAKLFVFSAIVVQMIVPGAAGDRAVGIGIYLAGMMFVSILIGVVESCMARLRLDRVKYLLLISFGLAFFGFIVSLWRK